MCSHFYPFTILRIKGPLCVDTYSKGTRLCICFSFSLARSKTSYAMLIRKSSKRVFCVSEMISELHPQLFCPPSVCENASSVFQTKPYSVPVRNRPFCVSATSSLVESTQSYRISRVVRTDAQAALFDYLHCTRGFHFTDADHISKNSPHFLHGLLSKFENEADISRALSKYFRYNPINEFEPFLESIGLIPTEFASLLPRKLMFLGDDHVMLDNYHVLCNYGIPRFKIGKMYKEAKELFGYESGMLAMKLRSYEGLGLSKSTVIKLVTNCPSLLMGEVDLEFAHVLEKLKRFGFPADWIGNYVSDQATINWNRMREIIDFLAHVGYSDKQMGVLFKMNSASLFQGSGKQVYVLVGRLLKLGIKMNQVYGMFSENPQILSSRCSKNLWRAISLLLQIRMETETIADIVSSHVQVLCLHAVKGPKTIMKSLNVAEDDLRQIIRKDPLKLVSFSSGSNSHSVEHSRVQNPNSFLEKRMFLLRLGYIENSDEMTKALKKFRGRGDQLQERFDCLVEAGLDFNVVSSMIRQVPSVLNQSKEVLQKKIDCLRNCIGYPLESIATCPSYLCYDMQRINLRFSMYAWLLERGAAKPRLSVSTLLACSDVRFVKYFVDIHPEGLAKWENLKKHQ